MAEIKQVKISKSYVVNLDRIQEAHWKEEKGQCLIYFSATDCTILQFEEAKAFWAFYTSNFSGCLDLTSKHATIKEG